MRHVVLHMVRTPYTTENDKFAHGVNTLWSGWNTVRGGAKLDPGLKITTRFQSLIAAKMMTLLST